MAISLEHDCVRVVYVTRHSGGKPVVEILVSIPHAINQTETLKNLKKQVNAQNYQCSLLLSHGEFQLFSVESPNVPPDELKSAMRWRLKDMLDYHIDDATIDVLDVPADKAMQGRAHSLYAVAARNQLIAERQAVFAAAGIALKVIDIPDLAQRNVSVLLEPESRGLALLSFDHSGGLLTVSYAGELYLSRRIDVSLQQLQTKDSEARSAVYERVALELQRSLDNFDRQHTFITTSKLVLAPLDEAVSRDLQAYLAANIYMAVETLDLADILDISKIPALAQQENQQAFFLAIGAALRHEKTVL
ncbi:agglutinin biogenesis protein MshI [Undibacterium sp. Jales W-56]|uniref:agglutinin biogenesis protein MshI n=1 Tax=Undibacterium sp. Jales W-56 TaxID=2897325 RepID=UPI0021D0993C|nr:agglutinin biogenesis protein MshI [Undibacterium sp. Jales W-56]MCU6432699.1 agglutinin biogenesis protein MshI [Undibacterium sp. Jales W-56]